MWNFVKNYLTGRVKANCYLRLVIKRGRRTGGQMNNYFTHFYSLVLNIVGDESAWHLGADGRREEWLGGWVQENWSGTVRKREGTRPKKRERGNERQRKKSNHHDRLLARNSGKGTKGSGKVGGQNEGCKEQELQRRNTASKKLNIIHWDVEKYA